MVLQSKAILDSRIFCPAALPGLVLCPDVRISSWNRFGTNWKKREKENYLCIDMTIQQSAAPTPQSFITHYHQLHYCIIPIYFDFNW